MTKLAAILLALLPAAPVLANPGLPAPATPEVGPANMKRPPPAELGPASSAVTNEIVDTIAEEMNRAMTELQIPGAPKPYHISYKITEVDVNNAAASLGQTTSRQNRHFVTLEAHVRVGSPQFDNGNFVVPESPELDGTATIPLAVDANPRIARRAAWLATDTAYKKALIQLRAKLDARKAGSTRSGDLASWTDEKPVVNEEPVLVPVLESLDDIEARAKAVSAMFRDQPALRESHVALTSYLERRWYLTSEGTNVTDTRRASGLVIGVSGQADDGQLLHNYFLRYGHTAKDLPSNDELKAESKRLAESIVQLAKAPVIDRYSGPVLFEGEGAVGLVRATLAPNLGGTPVPEGLNPQEAKLFGGALADKIGMRALSPNLTVVDDPTAKDAPGTKPSRALIGGYKVDDEGVSAQRVEVIKDGMLKTLLTTRTPAVKGQHSNGHARRGGIAGDGGTFHGLATNLFVIGRGGVPRKALEQQLLASARADGLKYGLVIRKFDDSAVTGAPEFTRRELLQMIKATDLELPPPATLAYRVYPNGKEELVRGVQLTLVPIQAWKDVIGVSTDTTVFNYLAATESQLQLRLTGGTDDGFVPSGGFESSIITPDLLFKELDVTGNMSGQQPLPVVAKPGT